MVGLIAIAGVALVWLWLFAPDAVPDQLRKVLMAIMLAVVVSACWGTKSLMDAHRQARLEAKRHLLRHERLRREAGEVINRENEALGYTVPTRDGY